MKTIIQLTVRALQPTLQIWQEVRVVKTTAQYSEDDQQSFQCFGTLG